jgi:hypothetical protein
VAQELPFNDYYKAHGNPRIFEDDRKIKFEEVIFAQKLTR